MAAAGSRPGAPGPIGHPRQDAPPDVRPAHPAPPAWQKGRARSGPSVWPIWISWPANAVPLAVWTAVTPLSRFLAGITVVTSSRPGPGSAPAGPSSPPGSATSRPGIWQPPQMPSTWPPRRRCAARSVCQHCARRKAGSPPCRFGAGQDHQTRIARKRPAVVRHDQPHAGFLTLLPVPWIIDARPRGSACRSG